MHLKRMSMKGFKSFADRVEMTFEPGVAVVVGPNGSGKSNIVDAIMWLMSSAPPSGMRAETGQDVLYLGSPARPAAQYCEVEAVFDNEDGAVAIPYQEVSIKRRLERGGDSTFYINGSVVRRLDIMELLADTGIGKDMHSIIGQGKIERLLAAKPHDRRSAIEEAAGLGKYKRRRKRAQQKLDRVKLDVARVRDIEKEMESRLRPLKAQANAANKYSTVLADRWTLQLLLHKDDVRRAGIELNAANARRDAARERVFQSEKVATELRAERDTADRKLKEAMEQAEAARTLLQRISSVKERLRIRHQAFVDRAASMRRGAAAGRARSEHAGRELERCERELQSSTARLAEVTTRVAELSKQRDEVIKQIEGLEQLFSDERQSGRDLAQLDGRVAVLRERRENLDTRIGRIASELGTLRGQRRDLEQRSARLVEASTKAAAAVADTLAAKTAAEQAQVQSQEQLDAARTAADAARADSARLEERQAMSVARIELLDERLAAIEAADGDEHGFTRLADAFEVAAGYERALAAALSDDAEALVVPDREALVAFASRVAGGSVRAFVPRMDVNMVAASASGDAPGQALSDIATLRAGQPIALAARLAGVRVVEDLDAAAVALDAGTGSATLLVTREGVAFDPRGLRIWSAGDSAVAEGWELRNQRDTAATELEGVRTELAAKVTAREQAQAAVVAAEAAVTTSRTTLAQVQQAWHEAQSVQSREQAQASGAERELADTDRRLERITNEELEAKQALEAWTTEHGELEQSVKDARERHASLAERVAGAREEERVAREAAAARNAELAGLTSELQALERDQRRLRGAVEQLVRDRDGGARQAARLEALEAIANRAAAGVQVVVEALQPDESLVERARAGEVQLARIDKLRREISEREQKVLADVAAARQEHTTTEVHVAQAVERREVAAQHVEETIVRYREHVEEAREQLERARAEAAASDEAKADADADSDAVAEADAEQVEEAPVEIALAEIDTDEEVELEPAERDRMLAQVQKLQRRLESIGPINPLAAREYEEQQVRHAELAEQRKDLEATGRELGSLINDLDETLVARFDETFANVKGHFEAGIEALFPGGSGTLKLVAPDIAGVDGEVVEGADAQLADGEAPDPGVEIVVKPAGKPAGRLNLLSGGEKSLVAVAFMFALFLSRPSPFYVLDEVEAALDDANIVRFLTLLNAHRGSAGQFIIITHQVRTMEAADVLYGVTMAENSGVSTVVARRPKGKTSAIFEQYRQKAMDAAASADAADAPPVEAVSSNVDEGAPQPV
jgi:chromosome segregation protein